MEITSVTIDQLKDMLNGRKLVIKLQGDRLIYCAVVREKIEAAATAHDSIWERRPPDNKLATAEAELDEARRERNEAINCRNIAIQEKRDIERDLSAATSSLAFCREALAKVDVLASRQLAEPRDHAEDQFCMVSIATIAESALDPMPDGSDEEFRAEMESRGYLIAKGGKVSGIRRAGLSESEEKE